MEEAGILEPYGLEFCDLMLLSSDEEYLTKLAPEEIERLETINRRVMKNLGPVGPGLLAITGVPKASDLRRRLLPFARKLALLNHDHRKRLLKEHGLGSDVPLKNLDRIVSSFAKQINYVQDVKINPSKEIHLGVDCHNSEPGSGVESLVEFQDFEFKNLGMIFEELGFCMMELGLCLARICDRNIGGQELEQSLLESGTAKGRLIHYHSSLDNLILKQLSKRKASAEGKFKDSKCFLKGLRGKASTIRNEKKDLRELKSKSDGNHSNLWQQWHYDYGIFTVLTSPMFMIIPCNPQNEGEPNCSFPSNDPECPSPGGHTYLQIFDQNTNRTLKVKASCESFIVQVGESADVLSNGKLSSTLHSVCRSENLENLSRETFVVFLQPAWSKTFSLLNYPVEHLISDNQHSEEFAEGNPPAKLELEDLTREFSKIVPPLFTRLRDGMTFAEFSRETTKQYYGGSGLQSKR